MLLNLFTLANFTFGFLLPTLLTMLFYCLLFIRRFRHTKTSCCTASSSSTTTINFGGADGRVVGFSMALFAYYTLCWLPHWIATLYLNLYNGEWKQGDKSTERESSFILAMERKLAYLMYGIHVLPYVNAATNWLLYCMCSAI